MHCTGTNVAMWPATTHLEFLTYGMVMISRSHMNWQGLQCRIMEQMSHCGQHETTYDMCSLVYMNWLTRTQMYKLWPATNDPRFCWTDGTVIISRPHELTREQMSYCQQHGLPLPKICHCCNISLKFKRIDRARPQTVVLWSFPTRGTKVQIWFLGKFCTAVVV